MIDNNPTTEQEYRRLEHHHPRDGLRAVGRQTLGKARVPTPPWLRRGFQQHLASVPSDELEVGPPDGRAAANDARRDVQWTRYGLV